MPLFKLHQNNLTSVTKKSMNDLGIRERQDLQQVLLKNIEAVSPDTLIIAEEFSEWEDSRRRIDLLGIDSQGNIVVIELKRTTDGGHMELQALRYAAMISSLSYERILTIFTKHLEKIGSKSSPEKLLLDHLNWDNPEEEDIATQTRIVLVSEDFGSEITTTVLWLNEQGLDIRCIKASPYLDHESIYIDIQQIIPLPEASDYMVRLREKATKQKAARISQQRDTSKFQVILNEEKTEFMPKRRAILMIVQHLVLQGHSPQKIQKAMKRERRRFFEIPEKINNEEEFISKTSQYVSANNFPKFTPLRWFTADDELIHYEGKTYALHNQWGVLTEKTMNYLLSAFPESQIDYIKE